MSTDPFEQDLVTRMGAAADTVSAEGVTREGIDERLATRRSARRRRQGGIALAAAALVVAAGIGAVVATGGEPETSVHADQGGTTEAPTTVEEPPTTECDTADQPGEVQTGPCPAPPPPSTAAPTSVPPQTSPVPTDVPPSTTEAPPVTTTPVTEPPTTTGPVRPPFSPTALAFVRGVIEGQDVSSLVEAGFDPVADMRSELPEDLTGFVAQPVDVFDWDSWSVSSANPHPDEPSCADVGDASVMCVVSVVRDDFALWLHVYMTGNGPQRVAAVDSEAD